MPNNNGHWIDQATRRAVRLTLTVPKRYAACLGPDQGNPAAGTCALRHMLAHDKTWAFGAEDVPGMVTVGMVVLASKPTADTLLSDMALAYVKRQVFWDDARDEALRWVMYANPTPQTPIQPAALTQAQTDVLGDEVYIVRETVTVEQRWGLVQREVMP